MPKAREPESQRTAAIRPHSARSPSGAAPANPEPVHPLMRLQRTIGNQAVGRILRGKLGMSQPGDIYEQEADRIASELRVHSPISQTSGIVSGVEHGIKTLQGKGQPLPESARTFFEHRFGVDLGNVRIHEDPESNKISEDLNARAFTVGKDIFFSRGNFSPHTSPGRELLAHELTHVLQQGLPNLREYDQPSMGRVFRKGESPGAPPARPEVVYPPVYWSIDRVKHITYVIPKPGVDFNILGEFLYGDPSAGKELASANGLSPSMLKISGQSLRLTGKPLTKKALGDLEASTKIPAGTADPGSFLAKKKTLDEALEKDFQYIVMKLDEVHYSDEDEGEVIAILRKWGEEKFATDPFLYPRGGEYLDRLFSLLSNKRKDVGILTTQYTSYYSLIFNHFDRVEEVKSIRDTFSRKFRGDRGIEEMSFGAFFWEQIKQGKVRDQIFAYFRGMGEAVIGLAEGIALLLTDPKKVLEGIGRLPDTLRILWKNREKIWNAFLSAKPEEQARIIGRIFGEAELIIGFAGAGGGGAAASAPELAPAVEIVDLSRGGAAVAALSSGGAISIDLGVLGVEGTRLMMMTAKAGELSVKGEKKAKELEAPEKAKLEKQMGGGAKKAQTTEEVFGELSRELKLEPAQSVPSAEWRGQWRQVRKEVFRYIFGEESLPINAEEMNVSLHHIVEKSMGGRHKIGNLLPILQKVHNRISGIYSRNIRIEGKTMRFRDWVRTLSEPEKRGVGYKVLFENISKEEELSLHELMKEIGMKTFYP